MLVTPFTACGSLPPSPAGANVACANAGAAHHAYVVVEHLSGAAMQRCVGFDADAISGKALMDASGIEYGAQKLISGAAVCQVDNEPKHYTQCFPQGQPYWALFIGTRGAWASAPGGFTDAMLRDGQALGWRYVASGSVNPSPPPSATEL